MADPTTLYASAMGGLETYTALANLLGVSITTAIVLVIIISIWTLIWKGLALWKAAGRKSKIWFVVLLIVNTVGILEILYIFIFSKMNFKKKDKKKK